MTYELALQLKDAGFPQGGKGGLIDQFEEYFSLAVPPTPNTIISELPYVPTLSELIAACGEDKFLALELTCPSEGIWHASTKTHECDCERCKKMLEENPDYLAVNWETAEGKTPEEAVARLYLTLKNNHKENA